MHIMNIESSFLLFSHHAVEVFEVHACESVSGNLLVRSRALDAEAPFLVLISPI